MDWENERYVRVYVRDTIDWIALGWEAQALFLFLVRKVDRSGVLEVGKHGARGVAGLVGMPVEVVERSLEILKNDGCVTICDSRLVIPNFIEAQEAKQSDKQRQKESRGKRRADSLVTNRDNKSHKVTENHVQSQAVTDGHTLSPQPSQLIKPSQSVPESTLNQARARDPGATAGATEHGITRTSLPNGTCVPPANEPGKPTPHFVVSRFLLIRRDVLGGGEKPLPGPTFAQPSQGDTEKAAAWLSSMTPEETEDIEPAIRLACKHVAAGDAGWTNPAMTKISFLFGCIVTSWPDLREELHGCAPKLPEKSKKQDGDKPKPRITPVIAW